MLSDAIAVLRKITRALLASNKPNQLAAGFTIGMYLDRPFAEGKSHCALAMRTAVFDAFQQGLGLLSRSPSR